MKLTLLPKVPNDAAASDLLSFADRVVVINLKRRPDRLQSFRAQLHHWPFQVPQVFEAVDGDKIGVPRGWTQGGGCYGCMASWRRVLEMALMDDVQVLIALEDDAKLMPNFRGGVAEFLRNVPSDWQMLFLGGQHMKRPQSVASGVVRCFNTHRTHAMVFRRDMMRIVYSLWTGPAGTTHVDHILGPELEKYKVYAPEHFLIAQASGNSDISGQRNPQKAWIDPSDHQPVILLHCPQPVAAELAHYGLHRGYDRLPNDIDRGLQRVFDNYDRPRELRMWIDTLRWECASEDGWLVTVWHPEATLSLLSQVAPTVIEVTAETLPQALAQLPPRSHRIIKNPYES